MINTVMLVGRLAGEVDTKEENGKKVVRITIASNRNFKNEEGIYEIDFFDVTILGAMAESAIEYCHKGDLVGIKGRLQMSVEVNDDGDIIARRVPEIIAEKLTILSSKGSATND